MSDNQHIAPNVPAVRLKGFTEEWNRKTLNDLGYPYNGLSGKSKSDFGHGGASYITYLNVFSNALTDENILESIEVDIKQNEVKYGDVFFTTSSETPEEVGMSSVWLGNTKNVYLNSFCFGYRQYKQSNGEFLAYYLRSDKFRKQIILLAQGISRFNISKTKVMDLFIQMPSSPEQQAIASYFTNLDQLIQAKEQQLEKLRNLKKASLQKMFPVEGETAPAVRLRGFTREWRHKTIGELCKRVARKNTNNESNLPLTISSIYGLIDQYTYFNNRVASTNVSNYYLIKNGEFAYNKSSSDGFPFGSIKRLDRYEQGVLSTLYIVFVVDSDELISDYLVRYFDTSLWYKDIYENASEGARNHGLLNISTDDFFKTNILYPIDTAEQQAIASYFTNLDTLIRAKEQQLEKLKNIKQASLKKMFA